MLEFSANSSITFGRTGGPMFKMTEAIKSNRCRNRKDAKFDAEHADEQTLAQTWISERSCHETKVPHFWVNKDKNTWEVGGDGEEKRDNASFFWRQGAWKRKSENCSRVVLKMALENSHICWLLQSNSSENLSCCLQRKTTSIRNPSSIFWEIHLLCNHCLGSYKQLSLFFAFLWHP